MREIGKSQDEEHNLRRQLAKAHYYDVANRWEFAGSAVAIILALVSPFILLYWPAQGPLLGAVAGVWIFLSRLLFERVHQSYQLKGAVTQELFDCDVLGLTWNEALIRKPSEEEIRSASKDIAKPKRVEKQKNWYPAQIEIAWPQSVITCQRANSVWSRRQQHGYGVVLSVMAGAWGLFGIILSITQHATLAAYLTTIALPSLPAVLDALEISKKHLQASSRLQQIEDASDRLLVTANISPESLREVQDMIFDYRRNAPKIPGWFYRLVAKRYEEDMVYAARVRRDQEERGCGDANHK